MAGCGCLCAHYARLVDGGIALRTRVVGMIILEQVKIGRFAAALAAAALSGCAPSAGYVGEPVTSSVATSPSPSLTQSAPAQLQNPFGSVQVKVGEFNGPCIGAAC